MEIAGAKNAALAILAAAIMTDETILIENLPDVRDINVLLEAIAGIGAQVADKELERVDGIAVDLQEAANQDTQEQRRVDFLGDQRQADGHDGRQQGRDGTVNRADNLSVTFCECGCGKNTCKGEYDEQEFPKASHAW